jgi:hypothetical protein
LPSPAYGDLADESLLMKIDPSGRKLARRKRNLDYAMSNANDGMLILDPDMRPETDQVADNCLTEAKPLVIGFTDIGIRNGDPDQIDMKRLEWAMGLTNKIAIGTSPQHHEWSPIAHVSRWTDFADKHGFQWVCSYIHARMISDLKDKEVRSQLVEANVPVFCLCGYQLACYVLGKPVGMEGAAMHNSNPYREYGLCLDTIRDYLKPLYCISGANSAVGLKNGNRRWCQLSGFTGIVTSGPFDRDDLMAHMQDEPVEPARLGAYDDNLVKSLVA